MIIAKSTVDHEINQGSVWAADLPREGSASAGGCEQAL